LGDPPLNYVEIIRNGIYQIIYRGRLSGSRISLQNEPPSGPQGAGVYILLRSSPTDATARIHVSTFDAPESSEYNAENCEIAAGLFADQFGVTVRYWCERAPIEP
jgi:hypothetical protein